MAIERWQSTIRGKPGETPFETFHRTEPEPVVGTEGVTIRYLSVSGDNPTGLPHGVFVETNIAPDTYNADMGLRTSIRTQVCLSLMDKGAALPFQSDGPRIDYANGVSFRQAFITGNGALVLQLLQATREETDRLIHGVEQGETRMKVIPQESKL